MREIKFRGRRIDNGEWVYGYLFRTPLTNETGEADSFLSGESTKYQIVNCNSVVFEIDIKTVGQFTGLKDKNKKEIYEGDIVKYMDFDMGIEGDGDEYVNSGEIKYDEESAMFFVTNRNMADIEEIWIDDILEVIGNVHKNKNLIKQP